MNYWYVIRTDAKKEDYVARQLARHGFEAWNPVQVIACRPAISRRVTAKSQMRTYREIALLPRRVLAAIPEALHGDLAAIRHLVAIERNAALEPLRIPANDIDRFRAAIELENSMALALVHRAGRKQKAQWRSMQDALIDMIDDAKGIKLDRAA